MRLWLAVMAAAFAAGCAVAVPRPVGDVSGQPAVVAMVRAAEGERRAGRLEQAAALLERALRIEPRNALLWHRLARIRLAQGAPRQAAGLAAKSNALAGRDRRLKAANWRLIGRARTRLGDTAGAAAAFARAAGLESGMP